MKKPSLPMRPSLEGKMLIILSGFTQSSVFTTILIDFTSRFDVGFAGLRFNFNTFCAYVVGEHTLCLKILL